jgi:hypothetical protein
VSLPPEILEPRRRQLGIAHRVLDVLMTQVCLQRPRVVAPVCKRVTAGVPEHVRVRLDRKFGPGGGSIDHAREASRSKWRT